MSLTFALANPRCTVNRMRFISSLIAVLAFFTLLSTGTAANRDRAQDKEALLSLENQWLHARDAETLDRILASDFVHIAPGGYVLSKAEHIAWFEKHTPPADRDVKLEHVTVRIYGDTGIVNGFVVNIDSHSRGESRTAFTDVFVIRDGRWQAVNAQEDLVDPPR
jgi:hypothetical protein